MQNSSLSIEDALTEAANTFEEDSVDLRQQLLPHRMQRFGRVGQTELANLEALIAQSSGSESRLDTDVHFLWETERISANSLAWWLIRRSRQSSPTEALKDLLYFLNHDTFEWHAVMVLAGVQTKMHVPMADGVSLVPLSQIPPSHQLDDLRTRTRLRAEFDPSRRPLSALIKRFEHRVVLDSVEAEASAIGRRIMDAAIEELEAARLCLAVAGTLAPHMTNFWASPSRGVPFNRIGFHSYDFPYRRGLVVANLEPVGNLRELHEAFVQMDEETKKSLKVPMQYMSDALSADGLAEVAIRMGVALESFFLSDTSNSGELMFRLCFRASRLLGNDPDSRRDIFDLFKLAYDLRSEAVHQGVLSSKSSRKPPGMDSESWASEYPTIYYQKLKSVALHLSIALQRAILSGPIDWDSLNLD